MICSKLSIRPAPLRDTITMTCLAALVLVWCQPAPLVARAEQNNTEQVGRFPEPDVEDSSPEPDAEEGPQSPVSDEEPESEPPLVETPKSTKAAPAGDARWPGQKPVWSPSSQAGWYGRIADEHEWCGGVGRCSLPSWFGLPHGANAAGRMEWGEPLRGTSWLNRPHHTSILVGGMIADGPIGGVAEQSNAGLVSIYQGFDFDHHWGGEVRLAAGQFGIRGSPADSQNDLVLVDAHVLYYPWGDTRWRPYYSLGLGFARNDFTANDGVEFNELLLTIPLAIGLKYQHKPHWAWRLDISHNISFGTGGLDTADNVSISGGLEWHYGGIRKSYFPWSPGTHFD